MCGSTIYVNTSKQEIKSPNHPNDYPSDKRCEWILEPQTQQTHIRIDFVAFNTERGYDYVTVSKMCFYTRIFQNIIDVIN